MTLLVCAAVGCWIISGTLLAFFRAEAPAKVSRRTLTFVERVAYQRAIEEVYWRHRIWPEERPDPKPSLDTVMSQAELEQKVEDYLRKSQLVTDKRRSPITGSELQSEMDRMAQHTKQPEVLHELFAALGNDPFVIAECLARPVLVEQTLATVASLRKPLEPRRAKAETQVPVTMAAVGGANYKLPVISGRPDNSIPSGTCTDDTWNPTSLTNAPDGRFDHTAVWTGSEMVVWGGGFQDLQGTHYFNTGGRYNPATDSWTPTSTTNAPAARWLHTAVWSGTEMIVWGGESNAGYFNTGGRYNPGTDSWTATSTVNSPTGRRSHKAVWTGSEMIVWGGFYYDGNQHYPNTGGRYNPGIDSWTATSTTNAPAGRELHTAVWTGSEMIVWGGFTGGDALNTGGRYNPSTDSWTATSLTNAPVARYAHTAVWTGTEMIVWGGESFLGVFNTGGRYNPGTDSWTATSTANAPAGRWYHTAVWAGSAMIVWGGASSQGDLNTGGRYDPGTDGWTATSTSNAPDFRSLHTAVWTGSQMIVWGGNSGNALNTGGRYCARPGPPPSPTPTATASPTPTPTPTASPTPTPTSTPCTNDTWTATSTTNAPFVRYYHTAVWTGSEMIVWGGTDNDDYFDTGGRYNPTTDSWAATSTTNAPAARAYHTVVWTGTEMIVWGGGIFDIDFDTGGRYNPGTDTWIATSTSNAPDAREGHTAVWTGSEMIVWGGTDSLGADYFDTGGRYNPSTDSWIATNTGINLPDPREYHTAV